MAECSARHEIALVGDRRQTKPAANETERQPLRLLDLPLDIVHAVIKHVTRQSDLIALALTSSTMYILVTPRLYAKFDIVWQDTYGSGSSYKSVDALTYGLATLVMSQDTIRRPLSHAVTTSCCQYTGCSATCERIVQHRHKKLQRKNHFAQYTRLFSISNAPSDLVKDYLSWTEGGKMLGTLVALAIGKMRNLESFFWDMPTGIIQEVWLALGDLAGDDFEADCRLDRFWFRCHDNGCGWRLGRSSTVVRNHAANAAFHGFSTDPRNSNSPLRFGVECPTFSILPALKSLSVLDMDQLLYADEMSVLIERSFPRLRELRVGIASHAVDTFRPRAVDSGSPFIFSEATRMRKRLLPKGLLERLFPQFHTAAIVSINATDIARSPTTTDLHPRSNLEDTHTEHCKVPAPDTEIQDSGRLFRTMSNLSIAEQGTDRLVELFDAAVSRTVRPILAAPPSLGPLVDQTHVQRTNIQPRKLALEILAFERVYLSNPILFRAIDWCKLKSLTILGCQNDEKLWRVLRQKYVPDLGDQTPRSQTASSLHAGLFVSQNSRRSRPGPTSAADYKLRITELHTDNVSVAFLAFVKDTLQPDSLNTLFLQQRPESISRVTLDQIFRSAVRRHRSSLRKLMIHIGNLKKPTRAMTAHCNRWVCRGELLTYITSGRMQLRELSIAMDMDDWHYFLQRLPHLPTLRSLHISDIMDPRATTYFDVRELAQQIVDVVALRPEIELCFVGIQDVCFEIVELNGHDAATTKKPVPRTGTHTTALAANATFTQYPGDNHHNSDDSDLASDEGSLYHNHSSMITSDHMGSMEENSTSDQSVNGSNKEDNDDLGSMSSASADDEDNDNNDNNDGTTHDPYRNKAKKRVYRLREILFYDDKITIFKARHGRL